MSRRIVRAIFLVACLFGGAAAAPDESEVDMIVLGVVSPSATFGLVKHLLGLPGVREVRFNLLHGLAVLRMAPGATVSDAELRAAVLSASYTPGDIRRIAAAGN